jgi:hypothetical protein
LFGEQRSTVGAGLSISTFVPIIRGATQRAGWEGKAAMLSHSSQSKRWSLIPCVRWLARWNRSINYFGGIYDTNKVGTSLPLLLNVW